MNKFVSYSLVLAGLMLALGASVYNQLPEQVPSHWNAAGEIDGYSGREFGAFGLPVLMFALIGLFVFIPKIEVFKANLHDFIGYYYKFAFVMSAFFAYLYLLALGAAFGYNVPMSQAMLPALAFLFYFIGDLLKASKRTFFIGIRTPWTLASDAVWRKTHDKGAVLYKALAVVILLGLFFPAYGLWLVIVGALGGTAYLFVYSYLEYRKVERKNGKPVDELKPRKKKRR